MPLVNPGSIGGQNWLEPYQNNISHVFTSNSRLSKIFINFDLELTFLREPRVNFWSNCLIRVKLTQLFRTLNSLSKSCSWVKIEIKTVEISSKLCQAHQLTSQGHNVWSDHLIFKTLTDLKTRHPYLSNATRINSREFWKGLQISSWSYSQEARKRRNNWRHANVSHVLPMCTSSTPGIVLPIKSPKCPLPL